MTKKQSITVPTRVIEAVAKWAGTDPTRQHLHQVLFAEDRIVAVDGHRLVAVPCPTYGQVIGVERRYLLAVVAAQRALKVGSPHQIALESDGQRFVRLGFGSSDGTSMVAMVAVAADTAQFPDFKHVLRDAFGAKPTKPPDGYRFNPSYLAAIHEVEDAMSAMPETEWQSGSAGPGVRVEAWGDDKLSAMAFVGASGAKYVIMPMRA